MTIKDLLDEFIIQAETLDKDYKEMTKTELANGYCDADEILREAIAMNDKALIAYYESLKSAYTAALMIRYWYKIYEWKENSASLHLPETDFVSWLQDAFYVVFYYRMWRYEYNAIVKEGKFIDWARDENGNKVKNPYYTDPNAPDKIINRCCGSIRGKWYQYYNHDKRVANVKTSSFDAILEEEGDRAISLTGCYTNACDVLNPANLLIGDLLDKGEYIEALVVDSMAYGSELKAEKTEAGNTIMLVDDRKIVKHLSELDEQYIEDFLSFHNHISAKTILLNRLNKERKNNNKLYKLILKVRTELATPETRELLSGGNN